MLAGAAALAAIRANLPNVLAITLLAASGIFGFLIERSMKKKSRAAWSCLVALCLVFGIVMLFAAPKIRGLIGVGLWIAMIVPGAFGIAVAALRLIRADYREPAETDR